MSTLTATPEGPIIRLALVATEAIPEITRNDANGVAKVRTLPGALPTVTPPIPATPRDIVTIEIVDREAALYGIVTYTAGDAVVRVDLSNPVNELTAPAPAAIHTEADLTPPAPYEPVTEPWIMFPFRPGMEIELPEVTTYDAGRGSTGTAYAVPGREDPLVALGRLAYRTGSLSIRFEDHESALEVETAIGKATVAMLKTVDLGLDMYFIPISTTITPTDEGWTLSVDYQSVKRPDGDLSVWTVSKVKLSWGTFTLIRNNYEDFDSLARNDVTPGPL